MRTIRTSWAWAVLSVSLAVGCGEFGPPTEIVLSITAVRDVMPVERIALLIRDRERRDEVPLDVSVANPGELENGGLLVRLTPGTILRGEILVCARGFRAEGDLVAGGFVVTAFVRGERTEVELELGEAAADADGDCFSPPEDCDDRRADVSPFAPEACEGSGVAVDDNCDGVADEGCPCDPGDTRPCYEPGEGDPTRSTRGVGACSDGIQTCLEDGTFGPCEGAVYAQAEDCGGDVRDDDCDGTVDELCDCDPGATRLCFGGLIGETVEDFDTVPASCRDRIGEQLCGAGSIWGECRVTLPDGEVVAWSSVAPTQAETEPACDDRDSNCDGICNDTPALQQDIDDDGFTECGVDRAGQSCAIDPATVDCNDHDPQAKPGGFDACNDGIDGDCDGSDVVCAPSSCAADGWFCGWSGELCYRHGGTWGDVCQTDGTCTTAEQACVVCRPDQRGDVVMERTACSVADGCVGRRAPTVTAAAPGTDPYEDCGAVACGEYFFGFGEGPGDRDVCYLHADAPAEAVMCGPDGACEPAAVVCAGTGRGEPVAPDVFARGGCRGVTGCSGLVPPAETACVAGTDPFGDCGALRCDGSDGGNAYYFGWSASDDTRCVLRADVPAELVACSAECGCQSADELCPASGPGAIDGGFAGRWPCRGQGTCADDVAPSNAVANSSDVFDDCGQLACDAATRYFHGYDPFNSARCLLRAPVPAAESECAVDAGGAPLGRCETAEEACERVPSEPGAAYEIDGLEFVRMACRAIDLCTGELAPSNEDDSAFAPAGTDPLDDCGVITCGAGAELPYYAGYAGTTCHYRADVPADDADCIAGGACEDASDRCSTQSTGPAVAAPPRARCFGWGTCVGNTPPSSASGTQVPAGQDPYGDCGAISCGGWYAGFAGDAYDAGGTGRDCMGRQDIPHTQAGCDGAGMCQTATELCPARPASGLVGTRLACRGVGQCSGTVGLSNDDPRGWARDLEDPLGDCAALDCALLAAGFVGRECRAGESGHGGRCLRNARDARCRTAAEDCFDSPATGAVLATCEDARCADAATCRPGTSADTLLADPALACFADGQQHDCPPSQVCITGGECRCAGTLEDCGDSCCDKGANSACVDAGASLCQACDSINSDVVCTAACTDCTALSASHRCCGSAAGCRDLDADLDHCGACADDCDGDPGSDEDTRGDSCATGSCACAAEGTACTGTATDACCASGCTDLTTVSDCNSCANACGDGEGCDNDDDAIDGCSCGALVVPGGEACPGAKNTCCGDAACTDLTLIGNCESCGNSCDPDESCDNDDAGSDGCACGSLVAVAGPACPALAHPDCDAAGSRCVCNGDGTLGDGSCGAGLQCCAGACQGPDTASCGACGAACGAGEDCDAGGGQCVCGLSAGASGAGAVCAPGEHCIPDQAAALAECCPASDDTVCGDQGDCCDVAGPETCVDQRCLLDDGQPCTINGECVQVCINVSAAPLAGTCLPPSDTAGACDEDADCTTGHLCRGNVCLREDGQACTQNVQCVNTCIGLVCAPEADTGAVCDAGDHADCSSADLGRRCDFDNTCRQNDGTACSDNEVCLFASTSSCIGASCTPRSPTAAPCDAGDHADCSDAGVPRSCDSDASCRQDRGTSCSENADCLHASVDSCIGDTCAPLAGTGDTCDPADHADCSDAGRARSCDSDFVCRNDDGQACTVNGDCLEICVNVGGAADAGLCGPLADTRGTCDEDADCISAHRCQGNECLRDDGVACDADAQCQSARCECGDDFCNATLCSRAACDCRWNGDGDPDCDGDLVDGRDDPHDSCGAYTCNGAGACNLGDDSTCTANSLCESNSCECGDDGCSFRRCHLGDCATCTWAPAGTGACTQTSLGLRGENCDGALAGCDPAGVCKLANGVTCGGDGDCASDQCECADDTCSARVCSAVDCDCAMNANGDGDCEAFVVDGSDDADDTCAALTCNGSGACNLGDGSVCTSDVPCESNHCECGDDDCAGRICRAGPCGVCTWNSDPSGLCFATPVGNQGEDCTGVNAACDGAGGCKAADGQACTVDSGCASNQCECADASCAMKKCSSVDCDCEFNAEGDGDCEGPIADGSDDFDDTCGVGLTCNGASACNLADGDACVTDSSCESDLCECADDDCGSRVCRPDACARCTWDDDEDGSCLPTPPGNKGEDCVAATEACDADGECRLESGETCSDDGDCGTGNCECADPICAAAVCSDGDCDCGYDVTGDGSCEGQLDDGFDEPEDSCGPTLTCNGAGVCNLADGASCTSDSPCESNLCECADDGCAGRLCHDTGCTICQYDPDATGACIDTPAGEQGEDCTGATQACDGAGTCKLATGETCTSDGQCGTGHCECANAECSAGVCSPVDCPCRTNADADGACDGPIDDGEDDLEDTCGVGLTCDGAAGCHLTNGSACTANNQCESDQCECANNQCTSKVCSASDCPLCTFDSDGDGTCEGQLADGHDDADDNCAALTCNGSGTCNLANGAVCTGDVLCESNKCECADDTCSARRCHATGCATCQYDADGVGSCTNTPAGNRGEDCTSGAEACNGAGSCDRANGEACGGDAECGSGNCECADASCSVRACRAVACSTCRYDSGAGCTLTPVGGDGENCTTAATSCSGSGACLSANGEACVADANCAYGNCECSNNNCTLRACRQVACATCEYDAGAGCVDTPVGNDGESCTTAATACDGVGACLSANGQSCAADSACASSACECSNNTCSARICRALACSDCQFDSGSGCGNTPQGNDGENCTTAATACNGGGSCLSANGQTCTGDGGCAYANCECSNNTCSARVCRQTACTACRFDPGTGCTNTPQGNDGENCTTAATACNGAGTCLSANGEVCTADANCAYPFCECADNNCAGRVCRQTACTTCQYDSAGTCTNTPTGSDGEGCTGATTACNGSGSCLSAPGQACTLDTNCAHSACECNTNNCAARTCRAAACTTCQYDSGSGCTNTPLANDGENCTAAATACNGSGSCLAANTQTCAANGDCASNACECSNNNCTARACRATACSTCQFDSGSGCGNTPLANDGEDCTAAATACNGSGSCLSANAQTCSANANCASNACECSDNTCSARACRATACTTCRYDPGSGCTNTPQNNDGEDCVGDANTACNGSGSCLSVNGQTCTADANCVFANCECSNNNCTARACRGSACAVCQFDSGSGCGNTPLANDGEGCTAAATACNGSSGAGACLSANAQTCTANSNCASNACECSDNNCAARACRAAACSDCQFDSGSGCGLTPVGNDGENCVAAASACDGGGACELANNQTCTADAQCASGFCECDDNDCTVRACRASACNTCQYDNAGTCTNTPVGNDGEACVAGTTDCDGSGGCDLANDQTCTLDSECASGFCECDNSNCTARACRAAACSDCQYDNGGTCTNTPRHNDGENCIAAGTACNGSGVCAAATGQGCSADSGCASENCECSSANCTTSLCRNASCGTCTYDTGSGACQVTPVGNDGEDCTAASTACDGGGFCELANGQSCTTDGECAYGNCECDNSNCTAGICRQTACGTCQYDDAFGNCVNTPLGNDGKSCTAAATACDGAGGCDLANGQACSLDGDCASSICECANATCSARICRATACGNCQYDNAGTCTNTPLGNDGENCVAAATACNGSGSCLSANAEICAGDASCATNICECSNDTCGQRRCRGVACATCRYDSGSGCTLTPINNDGEACVHANTACDGAGACLLVNGRPCSGDAECVSLECVCDDNDCSTGICRATDCATCQYDDGGGLCANTPFGNDGEACVAATTECNGTGGCRLVDGQTCTADAECLNGACECADDDCVARACRAVACAECQYDDGTGCDDAPVGNDGEDCDADATTACDGAGTCRDANGQGCSADAQCASGVCECADEDCSTSICRATACAECQWDDASVCTNTGVGTDGADCVAPETDCNGAGDCLAAIGQSCAGDGECAYGNCECADADCTARICRQFGCGECQYDTGAGCVDTAYGNNGENCGGATVACDGSGSCLLVDGETCASDILCLNGACECADADCTTSICRDASCNTCEYSASPTGLCDLTPLQNFGEDCTGASQACDGAGACATGDGFGCVGDPECASGSCECDDNDCTTGVCRATPCGLCQYDDAGVCTNTPVGNDGEDCVAANTDCNGSGSCLDANNEGCANDAECASSFCVCDDNNCSASICRATNCAACQYDNAGGVCTNTPLGNDGENCANGTTACNGGSGAGSCLGANGQTCTANNQCASNICECDDVTCTTRICRATACTTCQYDDAGGSCVNTPAGNDGSACAAAGTACDGTGNCDFDLGNSCSTDASCAVGFCECDDNNCSTRLCRLLSCSTCQYDNAGGACTATPAGNKGEDCAGATEACDASGNCDLANGQTCTADSQCGTGNCECSNDGCTARVCRATACGTCRYDAGAGCVLTSVGNDGEGCDDVAATACDGAGNCEDANGELCATDGECASSFCVCDNITCGELRCRSADCSECEFENLGGFCQQTNTGNWGQDCTGANQACSAIGDCLAANGQSCTADGECASGACECTDNSCSARACRATACTTCQYDSGSGCTNTPVGNDGEGCLGATTACNGSGSCLSAPGQTCSTDGNCAHSACECSNSTCGARVCRATACTTCQYNPGSGCTNTPSSNDGEDCVAAGTSCNGSGSCLDNVGEACAANSECLSNECECGDATCTGGNRKCAASDCGDCLYIGGGDGLCNDNIADNSDDFDNTCGSGSCNGSGACNIANGSACSTGVDSTCTSNFCVCSTNNCSAFVCRAADCTSCQYNTGSGCQNTPTKNNGQDCLLATNMCNGSGSCRLVHGQSCGTDGNLCWSTVCESGICVCNNSADSTCDGSGNTGGQPNCPNLTTNVCECDGAGTDCANGQWCVGNACTNMQ